MTCVGALDTGSPNPNVMMSGAKDGTITVWDIRSQKPAIHMAVSDPADDSAMVRLQPLLTLLTDCIPSARSGCSACRLMSITVAGDFHFVHCAQSLTVHAILCSSRPEGHAGKSIPELFANPRSSSCISSRCKLVASCLALLFAGDHI